MSLVLLACAPEQLLDPAPTTTPAGGDHPELLPHSVALLVDVEKGEVRLAPPPGSDTSAATPGLANSIIGNHELTVATSNLTRGAPVNGRVAVTFDVALTNLLTGGQLVTPTFPAPPSGVTGLLLIPFQIRNKVGPGTVLSSAEWDGAPYSFFNDQNCVLSFLSSSDCYRYEPFPGPLAAGATSAARRVGFSIDARVTSFTVLMVLAADIQNTVAPPPTTGTVVGVVASPQLGSLGGITVSAAGISTTSDGVGFFQLSGVPAGSVTVTAGAVPASCSSPAPVQVTVLPGGTASVQLSVPCLEPPPPAGIIVGVVTATDGRPLSGVAVLDIATGRGTSVNLDGSYVLTGLLPGTITLDLTNIPAGCDRPAKQTVTLPPNGLLQVPWALHCVGTGPGNLVGLIVGPNGPVAGVSVRLQPANLTTTSDVQGAFVFARVTPGFVDLSLANLPSGCTDPGVQHLQIEPDRTFTLQLSLGCAANGSLAGVLRDLDGHPIQGGQVLVQDGSVSRTVVSLADGSFVISSLPVGDYQVGFEKDTRCIAGQASATILAGQTTQQTFAMSCPPLLTGSATVNGTPFPGLEIQVSNGQESIVLPAGGAGYRTFLSQVTAYQVTPVHLPEVCINADPVTITVTGQQQDIPLDFNIQCATGTILGHVRNPGGTGLVGVTVSAANLQVTTDAGGAYALAPLFSGTQVVTLSGLPAGCTNPGAATVTVPVASGTTLDFVVPCPAPGQAILTPNPTAVDFATQFVTTKLEPITASNGVFITNTGTIATGILATVLEGRDAADFTIISDDCAGRALVPLATCFVGIRWQSEIAGFRYGLLTVSGAPAQTVSIDLLVEALPSLAQSIVEGHLTAPGHPGSDFANQTVRVDNVPVITDANGFYTITLDAGSVTVAPEVLDVFGCSAPAAVTLTVTPGVRVTQDFVVPCVPFGTIVGNARDLLGQVVRSGGVNAITPNGEEFSGSLDANGNYQITGVPAGSVTLQYSGGCPGVQQAAVVPANGTVTSNFVVDCPGFLSGIVSSNRGPVSGVTVTALNENTLVAYLPPTNSGGLYTMNGPDGPYRVQVLQRDAPAGCTVPPARNVTFVQQAVLTVDITLTCP